MASPDGPTWASYPDRFAFSRISRVTSCSIATNGRYCCTVTVRPPPVARRRQSVILHGHEEEREAGTTWSRGMACPCNRVEGERVDGQGILSGVRAERGQPVPV